MTLPVWTALTAVSSGKFVSKVVTDGTMWVSTAAGTTGAVEPTWPTTDPWTVTDGSTAWTITSSFRVQSTTGLLAVLTAFRNANPNLLKGVSPERPKSLTNLDLPGAYITGADEQDSFGTQLLTRQLTGLSFVVVDVIPDNIEAGARMDILVDCLINVMKRAFHGISGYSILQAATVQDIPIDEGGIPYYGVLFNLGFTAETTGANSP